MDVLFSARGGAVEIVVDRRELVAEIPGCRCFISDEQLTMQWLSGLLLTLLVATQAVSESALSGPRGWPGTLDGVWHWRLPDTPNGLRPTQSWHAIGSSPDGDIYIGGMDHATNSALYRLRSREGTLTFVGDAQSASEAAQNWSFGETAQKFHTRPLWHKGKIYVATMDRSTLDAAYLTRRGFHWYAFDPAASSFTDLSASEPGGSAVEHGSVVTLASDPNLNVLYAAGVPTGDIYRYDVARGRTEVLGRPNSYRETYVYTGRVMWVDSRGRLYFTASGSDEASAHRHLHYYDPETGFGERKDWLLKGHALEVGQCLSGTRQCFFSDDQGHVYRFDEDGPSWRYLTKIETGEIGSYIWLLAITPDGRQAFVATSTSPQPSDATSLFKLDIPSGKTRRLCRISELHPALQHLHVHTGYGAWDSDGRFYFASFRPDGQFNSRVIVTRVDPARLGAALDKP